MAKVSKKTLLEMCFREEALQEDAGANPVLWDTEATGSMVTSLLAKADKHPLDAVKAAISASDQSEFPDLFLEKVVVPNVPKILDSDLNDLRFITARVAAYLLDILTEIVMDKDDDDAWYKEIRTGFVSLDCAFHALSRTHKKEVTELADHVVNAYASDETTTKFDLLYPIIYHTSLGVRDQARKIATQRGCKLG